jgi:hypothetical protein
MDVGRGCSRHERIANKRTLCFAFGFAPRASSAFTHSTLPLAVAYCSAVLPSCAPKHAAKSAASALVHAAWCDERTPAPQPQRTASL